MILGLFNTLNSFCQRNGRKNQRFSHKLAFIKCANKNGACSAKTHLTVRQNLFFLLLIFEISTKNRDSFIKKNENIVKTFSEKFSWILWKNLKLGKCFFIFYKFSDCSDIYVCRILNIFWVFHCIGWHKSLLYTLKIHYLVRLVQGNFQKI